MPRARYQGLAGVAAESGGRLAPAPPFLDLEAQLQRKLHLSRRSEIARREARSACDVINPNVEVVVATNWPTVVIVVTGFVKFTWLNISIRQP